MIVLKYIILLAVVGLTCWLIVSTIVDIVKKVKAKKKDKENKDVNKTE